jgi:predicted PurR-regulated permease PerM
MEDSQTAAGPQSPDRRRRSPSRAPIPAFAVTGLFVLAVCYTLYFAREILIPVTAAVILTLVLYPLVRALRRLRIPEPAGAGLVVLLLFAVLSAGIYFLFDPAAKWMTQMPEVIAEIQSKIREPMEEIQDAREKVEEIVTDARDGADSEQSKTGAGTHESAEEEPESDSQDEPERDSRQVLLLEVFVETLVVLRDVGWSVFIIFVLLFFLLATSANLREVIVASIDTLHNKKRALAISRDVERNVSTYLATVTLINIGLGIVMGLAMYAIGLPNAALWGAMAATLNFMPYIGPIIGAGVVTVVGLLAFQAPVEAVGPPLLYIAINALEGNVITPLILSQRLTINPTAVFLSVVFFAWLWGVAGALMAVPMLACARVIFASAKHQHPIGLFLDGRRTRQSALKSGSGAMDTRHESAQRNMEET